MDEEVIPVLLHENGKGVENSLAFVIASDASVTANDLAQRFDFVVVFDPWPDSYERLVENAVPNLMVNNLAITASKGILNLSLGVQVPSFTLDDATKAYGFPEFILCRYNQVDVLEHGTLTLGDYRPHLLFEVLSRKMWKSLEDLTPGYNWRHIELGRYGQKNPMRMEHFWAYGTC